MNKKEQSLNTFNHQAKVYDNSMYSRHAKKLYPAMLSLIETQKKVKILDLGCGTGTMMQLLLKQNANYQLTGLDLSPEMINQAQDKLKDGVDLIICDSEKQPFDAASFDLVYCNDSFHHYPDPAAVLNEVARVLKPQGCLIIGDTYLPVILRSIANFFVRFSHEGDVRIYSKKEIITLLKDNFKEIEWKKITNDAYIVKAIKR